MTNNILLNKSSVRVVIILLLLGVFIYGLWRRKIPFFKMEFNGVVQDTEYTKKHFQSIMINDLWIPADDLQNYHHFVVGDSVYKKRSSYFYTVYKKDKRKVVMAFYGNIYSEIDLDSLKTEK